MKNLVTISTYSLNSGCSYSLLEIVEENDRNITFKKLNRSSKCKLVSIAKEDIKTIEPANYFKTAISKGKRFGYKTIVINIKDLNGDESFTNEQLKMVSENKTHIQCKVSLVGIGEYYQVFLKEDYKIERY